jgi:peptide/nickel transport system substrate-binding protein
LKLSRLFLLAALLVVLAMAGYWWSRTAPGGGPSDSLTVQNGGRIVSTYRSEPKSFNRYVNSGSVDEVISRLIHATLVRVDRTTGKVEPRLARSWTSSPDGLTWTFALEPAVTFADGTPFTSADVMFSFQALYDPKVNSGLAASLMIAGKPMTVRALDAHTVVIVFPSPYGPGISLLDSLPILPAHKLKHALEAGTFQDAWSVTAPLADITGLGPFVIREFTPGQRLVFARNPHFWVHDASGRPLPYLDEIELQLTPDQNTEVLRLEAGEADLMTDRVRVEDLAALRDLATKGRLTLHEAGLSISPDALWFNLDPAAKSAHDRPWLQREELRHAIDLAVNRTLIVNTIFLGQAVEVAGPVTPGNADWFSPELPRPAFDPAQAAKHLAAIGLVDRDGDGFVEDEKGRLASFNVLTAAGNSVRQRSLALIKEHLHKIGLKMEWEPLDLPSLGQHWHGGDYDAIYFAVESDAFDPGRNLDFWLSSGPSHLWHPEQTTPSTPWEGRLDTLMTQQSSTMDAAQRRQLFTDAQRLLAEHAPALYFAAPKVTVAASARLEGIAASALIPPVFWNAEVLHVTGPRR